MPAESLDPPPSSTIEPVTRLPLSPPHSTAPRISLSTINHLIATLRHLKAGTLDTDTDRLHFPLTDDEYSAFRLRLEANTSLYKWFEDRLRYDWEPAESQQEGPRKGRFVIRLPSRTHEFFVSSFVDGLVGKIKDVVEDLEVRTEAGHKRVSRTASELKRVRRGGRVTLELNPPALGDDNQESGGGSRIVKRSPDATFYHPSSPALPQLVIEVSYRQDGTEGLSRTAESYIVDSRHAIRCVIGVGIPFQESEKVHKDPNTSQDKQATISIWRPAVEVDGDGNEVGICRMDTDATPFRNADGVPCDGALKLTVSDFLPPSVLARLPSKAAERAIVLPFADLAHYIQLAETKAAWSKATSAPANSSGPTPRKLRKRKRSPSEELIWAREAGFEKREVGGVGKERRGDEGWSAGERGERRSGVHVAQRRSGGRK